MLAFGHFMFALYLIYRYRKNINEAFVFSMFSLIPDIDLITKINHRTITHTPLIILVIIPIVLLFYYLMNKKIVWKDILVISIILYITHIVGDIIVGSRVEVLPGIFIEPIIKYTSIVYVDAIFGGIFWLLLSLEFILESFLNKSQQNNK